jgi:hypothetical protein
MGRKEEDGSFEALSFTQMYSMSLCYVLAQYKVFGKGGVLGFCRIVYIILSPMFGWAGIREERASVLISYTPQYDTWNLMYSKTAQGKIFKRHDLLLFLTRALEKAL